MASGVSRRKHLPGITAWIGSVPSRTAASMRWICTGEVCVRNSTVSGSPTSRYMVSYMSRAGCDGGMFSASKLYQSDSASGPSATVKPMPTKTSSSSSRAWVTRCRWPRESGASTVAGMTSVRSSRSAWSASARSASASSARRSATRPARRSRTSLMRRPASLRSSGLSEPRVRWARVSVDRLPSSSVSTSPRASVDAAAAIARSPSVAMASMSRSTLSVTMSFLPRSPKCYVPRDLHPGVAGTPRTRPRRWPRPR